MPAQSKQDLMKVLAFKVSAVWKGSREDVGNIFWRPVKVPCIARISNQSILKEISPGCSLEELILKLKLQYFGHLVRRADSFEKTLILERLGAGGEGDDRGWDGWMASPTQWTWVWVNSRSWWWTGRPGMLQSMGSQSRTRLSDWTELNRKCNKCWRYHYRFRYNSVVLASSWKTRCAYFGHIPKEQKSSPGVKVRHGYPHPFGSSWLSRVNKGVVSCPILFERSWTRKVQTSCACL